jgi:hypothetical protein
LAKRRIEGARQELTFRCSRWRSCRARSKTATTAPDDGGSARFRNDKNRTRTQSFVYREAYYRRESPVDLMIKMEDQPVIIAKQRNG